MDGQTMLSFAHPARLFNIQDLTPSVFAFAHPGPLMYGVDAEYRVSIYPAQLHESQLAET